ncbi:MAG: hypothetical protein FWD71_22325 [Oscillospiraceae bacterium]|nr:hypothetical protein [Oscillospiraceae bacterium]
MDFENSFPIKPDSVTVVPGTSITYTFSALLSIDVGDTYKVIVNPTLDNHTGKEEIILEIGGTALPAVDNLGRYVTAQMFRNPKKRCHFDCDRFRVQIVANGATKAAAIRCGLSCRRSWLDVVTPPTP